MPIPGSRLSGLGVASKNPDFSASFVDATYAAAYDATNGRWLYLKDADTAWDYPASMVKIMTALLIMENKSGVLTTETVTVQTSDLLPSGQTRLPHQNGDVLTWEELLHSILIASNGDSAQAAARVIGNELDSNTLTSTAGYARFVTEMNNRAAEADIGISSASSFDNSYAEPPMPFTARDMCRVGAVALLNSTINTILAKTSYSLTITGTNARSETLNTTSDLASDGDAGHESSKTGRWTDGALAVDSFNIIARWNFNGNDIITCNMDSSNNRNRFGDARGLANSCQFNIDYLKTLSFSDVSLLLKFDGESDGSTTFTDLSSNTFTVTANGNAQIDTAKAKFGDGSLLLDGTGDYLEVAPNSAFDMGSNDFTVECWINGSDPGSNFVSWVSKYDTTSNQRQWSLQWSYTNDRVVLFCSETGLNFPSGEADVSASTLFDGNWHHLAGVVHNGEIKVFVDGQLGSIIQSVGSLFANTGTDLLVGARRSGGTGIQFPWNGSIDSVRVIKGVALYTGNFDPLRKDYDES